MVNGNAGKYLRFTYLHYVYTWRRNSARSTAPRRRKHTYQNQIVKFHKYRLALQFLRTNRKIMQRQRCIFCAITSRSAPFNTKFAVFIARSLGGKLDKNHLSE